MSYTKFGPDRFSRLLDTNKQTDRQTDKPSLYIDWNMVKFFNIAVNFPGLKSVNHILEFPIHLDLDGGYFNQNTKKLCSRNNVSWNKVNIKVVTSFSSPFNFKSRLLFLKKVTFYTFLPSLIVFVSRPFLFRVVTDSDELTNSIDYMNRGFHLNYHQLPCSAGI